MASATTLSQAGIQLDDDCLFCLLLFALTVHSTTQAVNSLFKVWHLDDANIAVDPDTVLNDNFCCVDSLKLVRL